MIEDKEYREFVRSVALCDDNDVHEVIPGDEKSKYFRLFVCPKRCMTVLRIVRMPAHTYDMHLLFTSIFAAQTIMPRFSVVVDGRELDDVPSYAIVEIIRFLMIHGVITDIQVVCASFIVSNPAHRDLAGIVFKIKKAACPVKFFDAAPGMSEKCARQIREFTIGCMHSDVGLLEAHRKMSPEELRKKRDGQDLTAWYCTLAAPSSPSPSGEISNDLILAMSTFLFALGCSTISGLEPPDMVAV